MQVSTNSEEERRRDGPEDILGRTGVSAEGYQFVVLADGGCDYCDPCGCGDCHWDDVQCWAGGIARGNQCWCWVYEDAEVNNTHILILSNTIVGLVLVQSISLKGMRDIKPINIMKFCCTRTLVPPIHGQRWAIKYQQAQSIFPAKEILQPIQVR